MGKNGWEGFSLPVQAKTKKLYKFQKTPLIAFQLTSKGQRVKTLKQILRSQILKAKKDTDVLAVFFYVFGIYERKSCA